MTLVSLDSLEYWKQEREKRYQEVRDRTSELSTAIRRATEVEEIIAEIEREKNGEETRNESS